MSISCRLQMVAVVSMFLASSVSATVLTFQTGGAQGSVIPAAYGDNVTSTQVGDFHYLQGNGWTPNITTTYSAVNADLNPSGNLILGTGGGWGGMDFVAYVDNVASTAWGQITFVPDEGWSVVINSFETAAYNFWPRDDIVYRILDEDDEILWDATINLLATGGTTLLEPGITHAGTLRLQFERRDNNFIVAVSNVNFDQIPEPATLILLACGGLLVFSRQRRLSSAR